MPPDLRLRNVSEGYEQDDTSDDEQTDYFAAEEDYRNEVLVPLIEELAEDQDDWARSEEEGWFYDDED